MKISFLAYFLITTSAFAAAEKVITSTSTEIELGGSIYCQTVDYSAMSRKVRDLLIIEPHLARLRGLWGYPTSVNRFSSRRLAENSCQDRLDAIVKANPKDFYPVEESNSRASPKDEAGPVSPKKYYVNYVKVPVKKLTVLSTAMPLASEYCETRVVDGLTFERWGIAFEGRQEVILKSTKLGFADTMSAVCDKEIDKIDFQWK